MSENKVQESEITINMLENEERKKSEKKEVKKNISEEVVITTKEENTDIPMTIDKYLDIYHPDLLPVQKKSVVTHYARSIKLLSEWKRILDNEFTRRS
jgi:hypothetical protein